MEEFCGRVTRKITFSSTPQINFTYDLKMVMPNMSTISHTEIKMKNSTFAIAAAPSAMPVKPSIPAIIAIIKKRNDQRSI